MRRGPTVSSRPGPPAASPRAVIGVGPGARPMGRLSTIEPRPPRTAPGEPAPDPRRGVGPGVADPANGSVPRPVPPPQPRPMHPPIARVVRPAGLSATAAQAMAAPGRPALDRQERATRPGATAGGPRPGAPARVGFGMPNLRRNVCPHFYMTGARGAIPIQAPHLLKALVRQDANVSRCQLRGGVHMEQGYVNDVCLSARFNQCIFYEDELGR